MGSFKLGSIYKITFWDHCMGDTDPAKFNVVGFVVHESPLSVTLNHWDMITVDIETKEANSELSTILKSCIISRKKLE